MTIAAEEELQYIDIGMATADAGSVQLLYQSGDLLLRYKDWQDQACEKKFYSVLAFRWEEFTDQAPRDDLSFQVINSTWLTAQAKIQEVTPSNYIHFPDLLQSQWRP